MSSCFTSLLSQKPLLDFICSLYPQAVFMLATLIPLNTYLPEKQSEQIILLFSSKLGESKLPCSGGWAVEHSVTSFSPHPCSNFTTSLQGTEILLNETDTHRFSYVFTTQKGSITSTKVAERRIIAGFSLNFWIFWIFPSGNKTIIF